MIEYKKVLDKDYDPKQAMQILGTSLDVRSREIAVSEKLDEKEDKDEFLDLEVIGRRTGSMACMNSTVTEWTPHLRTGMARSFWRKS